MQDNLSEPDVSTSKAAGSSSFTESFLLNPSDLFNPNDARRASHPDIGIATGGHLPDVLAEVRLERDSHQFTFQREKELTFADLRNQHNTFALTEVTDSNHLENQEEEQTASEDSDYDTDLEDNLGEVLLAISHCPTMTPCLH